MPQVGVRESRNNRAPDIRFLRITRQMRSARPLSLAFRYAPCASPGRSQEYENQKESQFGRPADQAGSYGALESIKMDTTWSALIIDDDPGVRRSMRLCLEANEARVMTVGTSAGGLEALDRSWFDVVFLDLWLQSESDLRCCRRFCVGNPGLASLSSPPLLRLKAWLRQ